MFANRDFHQPPHAGASGDIETFHRARRRERLVGSDLDLSAIQVRRSSIHKTDRQSNRVAGGYGQRKFRFNIERLDRFDAARTAAERSVSTKGVGCDAKAGYRIIQAKLDLGLAGPRVGLEPRVPKERLGKVGPLTRLAIRADLVGVDPHRYKVVADR